MDSEPTSRALERIFEGATEEDLVDPILQILSVKKVGASTNGADRYRLVISDGEWYMQAMLATNLNSFLSDGLIEKFTLVKMDKWAINKVGTRQLVVIINCEPSQKLDYKCGDPKSLEEVLVAREKAKETSGDVDMEEPKAAPAPAKPAARQANASTSRGGRQGQVQGRTNASNGIKAPIYPIEGLSPYQNKWTIKARVIAKSDIKQWTNAKGEGKLFSVTLMDESGEIKATGFNEAVDRLYNVLEENKVFFISKARINIAKKQFNNVNNEYEITFQNDSEVELCSDTEDVPQVKFAFKTLDSLSELEKDAMCDVIGVVKDVGELGQITAKASQRPISKREITLVDLSGFSIRLTMWGKQAENFTASDNPVIAFRGVKVGDFGGRSLGMVSSSTMMNEPDIEEAHQLRGWFDAQGSTTNFQAYQGSAAGASGGSFKPQEQRTLAQVKDEGLGTSDTPQYFNTVATVSYIKADNLSYPACPTDRCNKKLVMESNDSWRCEKCETTHEKPQHRYILSLSVCDWTGQVWLSGFNEAGMAIIGSSADDIEAMRHEDEAAFRKTLQKATGNMWAFSCRAKADTYNDQMKVRYQIQGCRPVDYVTAGRMLVEKISEYGILPTA